jgi:predicted nucleic acid-binding protein
MVAFADTSFLFAVYGNDAHKPVAVNWLRETGQKVCISELADSELCNALRFAEFAGRLGSGDAARFLAQYESDRTAGRLRLEICNLSDIVCEAKRLSGMYTAEKGHRAFDILHVATAISRGAELFLTFDVNQKKLAEAERLRVPF